MNKYKIDWIEYKTSAKGNKYARATLNDGEVAKTDIAIFSSFPGFETLAAGQEVEGKITEKDYQGNKSYTLEVDAPQSGRKPNMDRIMEKKSTMIGEAQEKKAQNVAAAQDRNEVMWAKFNAADIVAHHPAYKDLAIHEITTAIQGLANKILHLDMEPF